MDLTRPPSKTSSFAASLSSPSHKLSPSPFTTSFTPYSHFLTTSSLPSSLLESAHLLGTTPWKCSHLFPHAALYSLYIPPAAFHNAVASGAQLSLIVTIHGTSRRAETARDNLVPLAEMHGAAVMAPLFPMGVGDANDVDNYKGILYEFQDLENGIDVRIRYDLALLGILDEIAVRWKGVVATDRVWLTGFSGGGQFALRMWYLYPERWKGVSIGAPGAITRLNWEEKWPKGVGSAGELFGREAQVQRLGHVDEVQLVVGELDAERQGQGVLEALPGTRGAGRDLNRRAVMEVLTAELVEKGVKPQLDVVPGVGHDSDGAFPMVEAWLEKVLSKSK